MLLLRAGIFDVALIAGFLGFAESRLRQRESPKVLFFIFLIMFLSPWSRISLDNGGDSYVGAAAK